LQVVIHEALMLLQETTSDAEADRSSSSMVATVRRFIGAARNTKSLAKPPYTVLSLASEPRESFI